MDFIFVTVEIITSRFIFFSFFSFRSLTFEGLSLSLCAGEGKYGQGNDKVLSEIYTIFLPTFSILLCQVTLELDFTCTYGYEWFYLYSLSGVRSN
jgi:hypothetical protein